MMYQHVSNIHTCIQRQYVLLQSGFVTELSVAFLSSLTLSLFNQKGCTIYHQLFVFCLCRAFCFFFPSVPPLLLKLRIFYDFTSLLAC